MTRTRSGLAVVALVALVALAGTTFAEEEKLFYETREEIPIDYRWSLEDIFPDVEAWETAYSTVEARIPELATYKGRLAESVDVLVDAVELQYGIARSIEDIFVYVSQWQNTDTRDATANTYVGRARSLYAKFGEAAAFFEPEIVQISDATIAKYLEDPRLATYEHVLDNILRTKAHTRSLEVEEVLAGAALLRAAPQQTYGFLTNADIKWPTIKGEDGEDAKAIPGLFYTFMSSQDRRIRKDAALALFGTYDTYGNTYSGTYGGLVQKDVWMAKTRRYPSTLDMVLDRDNVPSSVVETLVSTVHDNLDAVHDYIDLRKQVLGLEDFHIYDLYVSMVPEGEATYTFDEGWALAMEFWPSAKSTRPSPHAGSPNVGSMSTRTPANVVEPTRGAPLTRTPTSSSTGEEPSKTSPPWSTRWATPSTPTSPTPTSHTMTPITASSSPRWRRWRRSRSSSSGCSNAPRTPHNDWHCSTCA